MRLVYLGTGAIGLPSLESLARLGGDELVGVVTQPDRPAGRGKRPMASPVKEWAVSHSIPVVQPESINDPAVLSGLSSWNPDMVIVCAFGQILKPPFLNWPKQGCLNIHASLLPRHRGASCIQAALLAGEATTGISIIQMDAGLDTGDVLGAGSLEITSDETAASLHDRLAQLAPTVLLEVLDQLQKGQSSPVSQNDKEASYAPKLLRQDGEIDWALPAAELERRVRAFHSWPGSFTFFSSPDNKRKRLKIFPPVRVQDGEGAPGTLVQTSEGVGVVCGKGTRLLLSEVQPEGTRSMPAGDWLRGSSGVNRLDLPADR